jgi:hypothetical protein
MHADVYLTQNKKAKYFLSIAITFECYVHFQFRLHRYILYDEANKTRLHLHMFNELYFNSNVYISYYHVILKFLLLKYIKLLHSMSIGCYHVKIIELLYNIYIKILALYYIILGTNSIDRVASDTSL